MKKFQNKYRIPSARANWHSYDGGVYFITICTKNMEHYFGRIDNGIMHLSELGQFLDEQIKITPDIRKDMNVKIPVYVIMPNHIHLIICIGENEYNVNCDNTDATHRTDSTDAMHRSDSTDARHRVSSIQNKFAPQRKNLASIIRGIKSITTKHARINRIPFEWHPRFHDHIIRNRGENNRIATYIENNVAKWESDRLN